MEAYQDRLFKFIQGTRKKSRAWDVLFRADNPDIWPFHCHISNNFTDGTGGMFTTLAYKL
ncbi:multicopper oxidase domain-containing protein [Clostridium thailandense]|uniref:multicopper oxidase domain-containing protein n=1 Tax=Clostridium thailandense TaxID=2794346 RepID=UPI00398A08FE